MFNFAATESATESAFLKPGVYELKVTKVELGKSQNKGTAYLEIFFTSEDDITFSEKFHLTEKAIQRLQYLHESFCGKKCEKQFASEDDVLKYFKAFLTGKKEVVKRIIVGGKQVGTRTYAELPYTGFTDNEEKFEIGEFEEDSEEWKKYVRKGEATGGAVSGKPNGIINEADDLEIGKGKPAEGKPAEAKAVNKGKGAKNTPATEEAEDDMPW